MKGTLHEDQFTFLIISRPVLLRMIFFSDESCRENQNTHFVFSSLFSPENHALFYIIPYLLTPWSTVLLEKLTCSQPFKKFLSIFGTRSFITAFTSARHMSLSWARLIHSMPSHPTSWRGIIIQLNLPKTERDRSGIFPPVFTGFRFTKGCVLIKQSTKNIIA